MANETSNIPHSSCQSYMATTSKAVLAKLAILKVCRLATLYDCRKYRHKAMHHEYVTPAVNAGTMWFKEA